MNILVLGEQVEPQSDSDYSDSEDEVALISPSSSDDCNVGFKQELKKDCVLHRIYMLKDNVFNKKFRMKRSTVEFLVPLYFKSEKVVLPYSKRHRTEIRKDIFMYVWYITHVTTYRKLGKLFRESVFACESAVRRVCQWLISICHEYIKWPRGQEVMENCRKFEQKAKIPGVVGVIDCTHITVKAPRFNKELYYNKNQKYSIVLQGVVNVDKTFIDVCCGGPGSRSDFEILRRSELYNTAENNITELFPDSTFILGDAAYSPSSWLVPPYPDNDDLTDSQMAFNNMHAVTSKVAKEALSLLKRRFRRLTKLTEEKKLCSMTDLVMSACILHNICILKEDIYEGVVKVKAEEENSVERPVDNVDGDSTVNRRKILFNSLLDKNIV